MNFNPQRNIMPYSGIPAPFENDTPFNQMHFWSWACAQGKRDDVTIDNYLASLGFILGTDKLTEKEFERLDYAVDTWHRTSPWIREPIYFDELFTPTGTDGYFVQGVKQKYNPTQKVIDAIYESGWIYNINSETTYFEIIQGNRLYAKYQHIIGSRIIAIIK